MSVTASTIAITYRYRVACPWCGTTFAEFTSTVPLEGITFKERRCHARRCDRPVSPRLRKVE